MPTSRVLLWILVVGALLVLVLIGFGFAPLGSGSADQLRVAARLADAHTEAAPVSTVAGAEALPLERAPVASSGLTVSGRIGGAKNPGCVWLGERRELGFARFTAEDGFAVRCTAPLARVRLRAVDARGTGRTWDFTRPEREASSSWDLGDVPFGGADVCVDLTIEYDPSVVRRMLATNQQRIVVALHEERANGPLVESSEFDLATFSTASRRSFTRTVAAKLASADTDVVAIWTCTVDRYGSRWPTLSKEERLGGELGVHRPSRLDLVPEQEVRGTVTMKNGEPCSAIQVSLMDASRLGPYSAPTATDGVYSFHVASDARGTVGLSGTIQAITRHRQEVPFAAGTVADLCLAVEKLHFRLLDEQGIPLTSYRARSFNATTLAPAEFLRTSHPEGVAWAPRGDFVEFPWLVFELDQTEGRVFLVPATWLDPDDRSIRELSIASFLPAGSLVVTVDGAVPTAWGKITLRVSGKAELRGFQIDRAPRGPGPWRIDGVPVGTYDYELGPYADGLRGNGEVVVSAGSTAEIRLTRR